MLAHMPNSAEDRTVGPAFSMLAQLFSCASSWMGGDSAPASVLTSHLAQLCCATLGSPTARLASGSFFGAPGSCAFHPFKGPRASRPLPSPPTCINVAIVLKSVLLAGLDVTTFFPTRVLDSACLRCLCFFEVSASPTPACASGAPARSAPRGWPGHVATSLGMHPDVFAAGSFCSLRLAVSRPLGGVKSEPIRPLALFERRGLRGSPAPACGSGPSPGARGVVQRVLRAQTPPAGLRLAGIGAGVATRLC